MPLSHKQQTDLTLPALLQEKFRRSSVTVEINFIRYSLFWDVMRSSLVVSDVLGQPMGLILNGSRLLDSSKMGPIVCSETSVNSCKYTLLLNILEERRYRLYLVGSLKSRKFILAGLRAVGCQRLCCESSPMNTEKLKGRV